MLITWSCAHDKSYKTNVINKLEEELATEKTVKKADELVQAYFVEYEKAAIKEEKLAILQEAMKIAQTFELEPRISSIRMGMVSVDPTSEATGKILIEMAAAMKNKGKTQISDIMLKGIAKNFESLASNASLLITDPSVSADTIIERQSDKIFVEDDKNPINIKEGKTFIDMVEAYAMTFPSDTISADYLFRGMQMARSLGSFQKALSISDMILTKYPDYSRSPSVLFVKAYMLENDFRKLEEAKAAYLEFLNKYPNDELAKDIEILLNNLGKSDEELFNAIRKQTN